MQHRAIARTASIILFFLVVLPCLFVLRPLSVSSAESSFSTNHQLYDRGEDIRALQSFLNSHGFVVAQTGPGSPGHETSIFGLKTSRALKLFQTSHGLRPSGFLGPLTRAALSATASTPSSPRPTPSTPTLPTPTPHCDAPMGLTCISGTNIIAPWAPGNGYTPGFGGGGGDTIAPTISSTADITAEATSASGASVSYTTPSATDNVDKTVSVSCSPSPGSTFAIGTAVVSCSATDHAGNSSSSSFHIIVRDTTAPSVSVTAPANGATVSGSSVTVLASASDLVGVAGVTFKVNGVTIGSEVTSLPYSISWDSTATSSGSKSIVAVARDAAGNYATSTSVTVTVDNTAPVISAIASSTAASTSTVTWTTDKAANSKVVYGTTSGYGFATSSASLVTSHSLTVTGLTASTLYHYAVVSSDAQGNTATSSDQTFTTTAPIVFGFYNFTGQNLAHWVTARAAQMTGTANAKIVGYGDSTVTGYGAGTGTNGLVGAKPSGWPNQLAALIASSSVSSAIGDGKIQGVTEAQYDPRYVLGSGWAPLVGLDILGGEFLTNTTANAVLSFTPTNQVDTFVIGYARSSNSGNIDINVDGAATTTIGGVGSNAQLFGTVTVALGTHTLNLVTKTGQSYINSIYAYNSAAKEVSVLNAGFGGATSATLASTAAPWGPLLVLQASQIIPDLVVGENGLVNDWNGQTLSASQTNNQAIITALKASGVSLILMSGPPSNPGVYASYAQQKQYVDQMKALAYSNNVPFINVWELMGGVWDTTKMSDNAYPNAATYGIIAGWVNQALSQGFVSQ
jgi:lysophospholipase L1-like esterase